MSEEAASVRGVQPWLQVPVILSAAVVLGGLVSASVISRFGSARSLEQWQTLVGATRNLFRYAIVPGVICLLLFGTLLLLRRPRVFLRMRWMQVKLVLLAAPIALHFRARGLMHQIVQALEQARTKDMGSLMDSFTFTCDAAILAVVLVVLLGRLKPALGQAGSS